MTRHHPQRRRTLAWTLAALSSVCACGGLSPDQVSGAFNAMLTVSNRARPANANALTLESFANPTAVAPFVVDCDGGGIASVSGAVDAVTYGSTEGIDTPVLFGLLLEFDACRQSGRTISGTLSYALNTRDRTGMKEFVYAFASDAAPQTSADVLTTLPITIDGEVCNGIKAEYHFMQTFGNATIGYTGLVCDFDSAIDLDLLSPDSDAANP